MTDKNLEKKYKEFSEERAKKLYEDLLLQFLRSNYNEIDASEKVRSVIRKQCEVCHIGLGFNPIFLQKV